MPCDVARLVISHAAPTPSTNPPRLEMSVADQRERKVFDWNATSGEGLLGMSAFLRRIISIGDAASSLKACAQPSRNRAYSDLLTFETILE